MALDHAKADLSRRAVIYFLPILSYREYLELETVEKLQQYTLNYPKSGGDFIVNDSYVFEIDGKGKKQEADKRYRQ